MLSTSSRRGGELGVAPVELAVQLAAAELGEDLPHARRLAETELRHVGAGDLEPDSGQAREVVVELRQVGEGEREERRVRGVRLGNRDDVGRSRRVAADLLRDLRRLGDRCRDQVCVTAPHLQPVQPGTGLIGRQLARERREP